jgi:hypothetical protein
MREEAPNEVRDLFIRLQAGTPLTAQEKRDAWPGDFTTFVIRHAGKPNHPDSSPKTFFKLVSRGKSKMLSVDDGEHYVDGLADTRKFFAGLAMTIMVRHRSGVDFVDLKGKTINEFYKENLVLQPDDPAADRVLNTLDDAVELPGSSTCRPRIPFLFRWPFTSPSSLTPSSLAATSPSGATTLSKPFRISRTISPRLAYTTEQPEKPSRITAALLSCLEGPGPIPQR